MCFKRVPGNEIRTLIFLVAWPHVHFVHVLSIRDARTMFRWFSVACRAAGISYVYSCLNTKQNSAAFHAQEIHCIYRVWNSKSYCRSMFLRRLPMNVERKRKSHEPSISEIDSDRRASSGSTESGSHLPHRHARNSSHSDMCYSTATCHFKMLL